MPKSTWMEVFKTGTQTSSNGIIKTYSREDLDTMVSIYNEQKDHEAPLVIGHPKTEDEAYGWVKELKRVDDKLMAFVDCVADHIVESVERGSFRKVSIALYPSLLLRHVGLLGAAPPAVKGLAPITFADEDQKFEEYVFVNDEWRIPIVGRILRSLRDMWIEKFGKDEADKVLDNYDIELLSEAPRSTMLTFPSPPNDESIRVPPVGAITSTYSEKIQKEDIEMTKEEIQDVVKATVAEAMAGYTNQFSELTGKINDLASTVAANSLTEAEKVKQVIKDGKIKTFSETLKGLIKEGKVLPAEEEALATEYAEMLTMEDGLTFAEGQILFSDRFVGRLTSRPQIVTATKGPFANKSQAQENKIGTVPLEFSEIAEKVDPASLEIDTQIRAYAEEHKVSYEVAADHYCRS